MVTEKTSAKSLRIIVGIALSVQSLVFFLGSWVFFVLIVFIGSLAFLGGAGSATEEQIKSTEWMLLFSILCPFIWTIMLVLAAINMLLCRRPVLIIVFCVISILNEMGLILYSVSISHRSLQSLVTTRHIDLKVFALLALLIPLAAIVVAFRMKANRHTSNVQL